MYKIYLNYINFKYKKMYNKEYDFVKIKRYKRSIIIDNRVKINERQKKLFSNVFLFWL